MNRMTCHDGAVKFQRVSKVLARKAWAANKTVVFCPVNLFPFGGWRPSITLHPDCPGRDREFNEVVRYFEYYNCTDSETGAYASFFVEAVK